ncbi:M56 family metallopeptidase [Larkinella bovis]|uniref:M56 family metallopeptidase n=1 Tax=Larkinella bovis TaxID=683041 RepID=A0ABW0IJP2_9BACT
MNFSLNQLLDQTVVKAVGFTLLHSLWQGFFVAIVAGLVLLLTRRAKPDLRYNLFMGLLALFTISVGVTFSLQLEFGSARPVTEILNLPDGSSLAGQRVSSQPETIVSYVDTGLAFFNQHLSSIVLVWLLILLIKSVQFGINLYQLNYLRRYQTFPIGLEWEDRVRSLAEKVGIHQTIRVVQSGLVNAPMVLGQLKPIILLPLGALVTIPAAQIELMLLHELAHIKRLDFVVNLWQYLLELLFFFNPALLWLSALIRAEREACCDERVVSQADNKRDYIQALLSFREYQLEAPTYSLAFAGKKGLIQRVERLVLKQNTALNLAEKLILALSLVLIFTVSLLYAQPISKPPSSNQAEKQQPEKPGNGIEQTTPSINAQYNKTPEKVPSNVIKGESGKEADPAHPGNTVLTDSSRQRAVLDESQPDLIRASLGDLSALQESLVALRDSLPAQYERPKLTLSQPTYSPKPLALANPKPNPEKSSVAEQLIDAVVDAGLSPSRDNLSFHITNDFLIVNGVKQPEEVHQRIISKFVKKPGDIVDFTYRSTR